MILGMSTLQGYLIPLESPTLMEADDIQRYDHARFAQVRSWMDGTHPHVRVGQVWEDMDTRRADEHGMRQVMVTHIDTDGTVDVVNVNYDGHGARINLGHTSRLAAWRMRPEGINRGWRVRAITIPLDGAGRAKAKYELPRVATPTSVAPREPKKIVPAPKPTASAAPSTEVATTKGDKRVSFSNGTTSPGVKNVVQKAASSAQKPLFTNKNDEEQINALSEKIANGTPVTERITAVATIMVTALGVVPAIDIARSYLRDMPSGASIEDTLLSRFVVSHSDLVSMFSDVLDVEPVTNS